jgi:hypothetical protein
VIFVTCYRFVIYRFRAAYTSQGTLSTKNRLEGLSPRRRPSQLSLARSDAQGAVRGRDKRICDGAVRASAATAAAATAVVAAARTAAAATISAAPTAARGVAVVAAAGRRHAQRGGRHGAVAVEHRGGAWHERPAARPPLELEHGEVSRANERDRLPLSEKRQPPS